MKGRVGTSMMQPGERSRVLDPYALSHVIKARQVLMCRERYKFTPEQIEVCEWAVKYPLGLRGRQLKMIYAIWMTLAEGGYLKGLARPRKE